MASDNLNLVRVVERPEQYFPRKQLCTRLPDGGLFRYTYADFGPRVRRLASALASIGVRKMPGAMVTTRMPERARSRASGRVMPTTPPLEAE